MVLLDILWQDYMNSWAYELISVLTFLFRGKQQIAASALYYKVELTVTNIFYFILTKLKLHLIKYKDMIVFA